MHHAKTVCPRSTESLKGAFGVAACSAALLLSAPPALAQDGSVRRAVRAGSQGAVLDLNNGPRAVRSTFFRPLRTFRGQPVRVGPGNRPELSIGVVRAIRADGSKSIGVVRPIRGFESTPPLNAGGLAVASGADPYAVDPAPDQTPAPPARVLVPGIAGGPEGTDQVGSASLRVFAGQPRPVVDGADPWGLLNAGRYLAAAERFDATGDDAQRTGAALAAVLSGDLSMGAAVMPDEPVLPAGVSLDANTTLRLRQIRAVFYEDNAAMRGALAGLVNGG